MSFVCLSVCLSFKVTGVHENYICFERTWYIIGCSAVLVFWAIWILYGSEYCVDQCNKSCLSIRLVLCCKKCSVWHYMQTVRPIFFTPAMLIGITDIYHFILFSLTLTLLGCHKISVKQTYWLHISHTLHLIRMKFGVVVKQFKLNKLRLLLSKIYWNKWNN